MVDKTHNQYKLDADAKTHLIKAVKRIEKMDEEIAEIQDDKKSEFAHLKSLGYYTAAIREFIAERKKKRRMGEKYDEREDMKDLYRAAVGLD